MGAQELQQRTKKFALNTLVLLNSIPYSISNQTIKNQLARSATGTAANYRAALKARSHKEFISKLGLVVEEADESWFWLDLLQDLNPEVPAIADLKIEAHELTAIFVSSVKRLKAKASENSPS
jgi:four helix bundle protein